MQRITPATNGHDPLGICHRRQRFVVDVDGGKRPDSGAGVARRDRGNGFALVAHNVTGEHRLVRDDQAVGGPAGHVPGGHHRRHARKTPGRGGVDTADPGTGVRAAQRPGVQHARQEEIASVRERPVDLVRAIRAGHRSTDALTGKRLIGKRLLTG